MEQIPLQTNLGQVNEKSLVFQAITMCRIPTSEMKRHEQVCRRKQFVLSLFDLFIWVPLIILQKEWREHFKGPKKFNKKQDQSIQK